MTIFFVIFIIINDRISLYISLLILRYLKINDRINLCTFNIYTFFGLEMMC